MENVKSVGNEYFAQVAEKLKDNVSVRLFVNGNSMIPFIKGGKDSITLKPYDGEDLPLGIAALYKWNGSYMIHRLVKKEGDSFHFLGDGNICRFEIIKRDEVLGILQTIHHADGTETDATGEKWRKYGMLWYKIRPLRRYVLFLYRRINGVN